MIVIIAVVVFYFCTYAEHRLEKVVRQVNVLPKVGDNYPSVGSLSRQEYWSGLPFPSLGTLPN